MARLPSRRPFRPGPIFASSGHPSIRNPTLSMARSPRYSKSYSRVQCDSTPTDGFPRLWPGRRRFRLSAGAASRLRALGRAHPGANASGPRLRSPRRSYLAIQDPTRPQLLLDSAAFDRLGALAIYLRSEKGWFKILSIGSGRRPLRTRARRTTSCGKLNAAPSGTRITAGSSARPRQSMARECSEPSAGAVTHLNLPSDPRLIDDAPVTIRSTDWASRATTCA